MWTIMRSKAVGNCKRVFFLHNLSFQDMDITIVYNGIE